ncbi:hypothetical protein GUJ93_ZPchr0001g32333 [Zizania palustris]|uniref:Uncharacterized protein n=1 Tax=Zizania palustris TaxID=103762 RepID=A0A8J5VL27_ZIZPA|nr:hypothetical protein GUJ93_ZPchr0001g32333 [Zizania palustris]
MPSLQVAAAPKAELVVEAPFEEVVGPLPPIEMVNMETNTVLSLLPASGNEGLLQQPLSRPPSPIAQSEPCFVSPEEIAATPGFENLKSSSEPCSLEEMARHLQDSRISSHNQSCSPEEMSPPGFENFKSSWLPFPALSQTTYALPDAGATGVVPVMVEDAAGPPSPCTGGRQWV